MITAKITLSAFHSHLQKADIAVSAFLANRQSQMQYLLAGLAIVAASRGISIDRHEMKFSGLHREPAKKNSP